MNIIVKYLLVSYKYGKDNLVVLKRYFFIIIYLIICILCVLYSKVCKIISKCILNYFLFIVKFLY